MSSDIVVNETSGPNDCRVTGTQVGNKRPLDVYDLSASRGPLDGLDWDSFLTTYPTSTTEVWAFYSGGTSGTLLATMTLTFSDSTKCSVISGETVYP